MSTQSDEEDIYDAVANHRKNYPTHAPATGCEWGEDEDGVWYTSCGNSFVLEVDGPIENGMKYCCYCGLALDELPYDETDETASRTCPAGGRT